MDLAPELEPAAPPEAGSRQEEDKEVHARPEIRAYAGSQWADRTIDHDSTSMHSGSIRADGGQPRPSFSASSGSVLAMRGPGPSVMEARVLMQPSSTPSEGGDGTMDDSHSDSASIARRCMQPGIDLADARVLMEAPSPGPTHYAYATPSAVDDEGASVVSRESSSGSFQRAVGVYPRGNRGVSFLETTHDA